MRKLLIFVSLFLTFASLCHAQLTNYIVGDIAPDFTVTDEYGTTQNLNQLTNSGKYVFLDFFAYWCESCMTAAPFIDQFYKKYGCNYYDVAVLGLEFEGSDEQLLNFNAMAGLPADSYPSASGIDGNAAAVHTLYGTYAFPTFVIIGPDRQFKVIAFISIYSVADIELKFPNGAITPHNCNSGIDQNLEENDLSMYPNPANKYLFFSGLANNTSISICDLQGKLLIDKKLIEKNLEISSLLSGVYFVKIKCNNTIIMKKLIKQ